jgi:Zn-dependent M28 family amino/carboxypeptidase
MTCRHLLLALPLALFLYACSPEPSAPPEVDISASRIAAHTKFLSIDEMGGREPGTPSEILTTEYIAAQFAMAGIPPAGDDGTYFQRVPLVGVKSLPETTLHWQQGARRISMTYLDDFVAVNHQQLPSAEIDAETVFVGHGIVAPEFGWDDYKGTDVTGKVVVLFTNEPPSEDPAFFGGKALTYYGRWTFKYEEAARRGAAGCIIIHTDPTAGYGWQVVRNSWGGQNPYVKLEAGQPALALAGWVTSAVGQQILAGLGDSLEQILAQAETKEFRPVPLSFRLHGRIQSEVRPMDTRNVVAMLEGSDPVKKSEAVLYTAHWDHLGVGVPVDGDAIYNGAVDNATGTAVLIELARAWGQADPKPARSIIFAAVGAEEGGLRGSEYYAHHPVVPVGKTAVNLNYDGLFPFGLTSDIALPGHERTTLRSVVEETAREFNLTLRPDAHPEQGYYYRSDHFSMAKVGVPAFSVGVGADYIGKPEGWGLQAYEQYRTAHYHQPSDEFDPSWDFSGLEMLARFGYVLGGKVANLPELPTWNPGDEFLAARESSWAGR